MKTKIADCAITLIRIAICGAAAAQVSLPTDSKLPIDAIGKIKGPD